jgi:hypothetical protein
MDADTARLILVFGQIGTFIILICMLILIAVTLWKFRR